MSTSHPMDGIYNDRSISLVFLVTAFVVTVCIVTVSPSHGAPAPPRKKPHRPACLPQACVMIHAGFRYDVTFAPDGSYRATASIGGTTWHGTWRLDGRTLSVSEHCQFDGVVPYNWIFWDVELDETLRRSVRGDRTVRLKDVP